MANISGGELIARMLAAEGVDTVFGIIDGTYLGLNASFKPLGIRLITPRHETSAAHMAGAYARSTGRLGVCIASNGPGVANVLPGVAVENGEGNRVLLITSCRRHGIIYPDRGGAYQYFNQVAVTRPMTKWSGAVADFERIPELLRRALRLSFTGRPGVVHLDVPEDIVNGKFSFDTETLLPPERYRRTRPLPAAEALVEDAATRLAQAECPMIHAGSGVIHARAAETLAEVATFLQAPVTTSWGGRGAVPEDHDCAIPMVHLGVNREVRNAADLVLALGTRFGETDWWGKPPYWREPAGQHMIQVDIDEEMLGLNKPVDLPVVADAGCFLEQLLEALRRHGEPAGLERRHQRLAGWRRAVAEDRRKLDRRLEEDTTAVHPARVPGVCQEVFGDDAMWVLDGGNTVIWGMFYHQARRPFHLDSTFKFGMLGAGVGQALGIRAAWPEREVCCIIGDGAMGFHPQEIETAVRNGLKVVFVVMADKQWGMVKMTQQFALRPIKTLVRKQLGPDETINADLGEIAWDRLAESMGAWGIRVSRNADLRGALEQARAQPGCAVVHVDVDPVAHMWAPNLKSFKEMHAEPGA